MMADDVESERRGGWLGRGDASGWFAIESDHTIRGWCRAKGRPRQRLNVAITIDGAVVTTLLADRFNRRLVEVGEGDGRSAFVYAVPAALCDDAAHEVRVEIVTPGFAGRPLKSKQATFALPPNAALPAVTLHRLGPEAIEGVLTGFALREELDVWLDGRRLDEEEYLVEWQPGDRQRLPFSLTMKDRPTSRLMGDDLALAYPGVREAGGVGARLSALVNVDVMAHGGGDYVLHMGAGVSLPRAEDLIAIVLGEEPDSPVLAERTLRLFANRAGFSLEEADMRPRMRLRLKTIMGATIGPDVPFARGDMPRRLIGNGAFVRWTEAGPTGFTLADGIKAERGFYAFPAAMKRQHQISGNLLSMPIAGGGEDHLVLRHALRRIDDAGHPIEIGLGCLARASAPVRLTQRIVADDGTVHASAGTTLNQRWKRDSQIVGVDRVPAGPLHLEVSARVIGNPEGCVFLDLAGLHCGQPDVKDFADAPAALIPSDEREAGANLVVNADLLRWPEGLAPEVSGNRFELAEGWVLAGAENAAGARVAALPAPDDMAGRYALALALPHVPEVCRLDVALDVVDLAGGGEVSFGARLGKLPVATGGGQVPPPWGLIERISILRRQTYLYEDDAVATPQRVALVARRVVLTGAGDTYRYAFAMVDAADDRIDLARTGDGPAEYFLSFEFRQPIALVIHGLSVRAVPDPAPEAVLPLAFEDRIIRGQLDMLRGVDAWRATDIMRPGPASAPTPAADPGPPRWSWRQAALGSVEVAICVHDAADETLACLAALVGASGVPHTVRIVDDGSGEDTRRRLAAFVADKPWMTLVSNEANRGYTASANRAVRGSSADWVILLNSDTIVSRGWIEGLLTVAASDPGVALVGPVSNAATYQSVPELYDATGKWAVNPLPPGFAPADMARLVGERATGAFPEVPLLNGFCTLIRRSAFLEVGGFDEQAFPAGYGEENDLCLRMTKTGWRLRVADHVYVYHVKSASFGAARRVELAKAGDRALRALHPDVDIGALGRRFLATPALVALRTAIAAAYPVPGVGIVGDKV